MRLARIFAEESHPNSRWWPERIAVVLALVGVLFAALADYHVREWEASGSDFKTLYASSRSFRDGASAYTFDSIGQVFAEEKVVPPKSWYGHSPIYPPFTLALLAPITAVPMVQAVYVWLGLSAFAITAAIWLMADAGEREFGLTRRWRIWLIVLVAASPLVSFGLEVGNVSPVVSALCIMAVMFAPADGPLWPTIALLLSFLLKPHITLWLLAGMFVSRIRGDRKVVWYTLSAFAGFFLLVAIWAHFSGPLGLQLHGYQSILRDEMARGSMDPRDRELIPAVSQITSLELLLGYFIGPPQMEIASGILLLALAFAMVYVTRKVSSSDPATRLEVLGTWCAFGMFASYHRSHDAIVLLMLLPWALARLKRSWTDGFAWSTLLLLAAVSISAEPPDYSWFATALRLPWLSDFLDFRQSAAASLLVFLVLLVDLFVHGRAGVAAHRAPETAFAESP